MSVKGNVVASQPYRGPDARQAVQAIGRTLGADAPHGAAVEVDGKDGQSGWHAPALDPWVEQAVAQASQEAFGKPAAYMGEGGTIPFMGMLSEKFPHTQFVITGVLGPHANARTVPTNSCTFPRASGSRWPRCTWSPRISAARADS